MAEIPQNSPTVLLVDDEAMIHEVVGDLLVEEGLTTPERISFASNGEEGLKVFQAKTPQVVISDMMMPRMNGREMLQKIRDLNSETELVLMTAYADIEMAVSAIQVGVSDLLRKPFEPRELKVCFQKIAQKLALKRENREYRERLNQAERFSSLGVLSAGLSLELEKPHRDVVLAAETLSSAKPDSAEFKNSLAALRGAGDEIGKLLAGLSRFHRTFAPEAEALNVEGLVQEALLATSARIKHHDVQLEFPSGLPAVKADRRDAIMAFVNILSNATDAVEERAPAGRRGKIRISARVEGNEVAISFEDDGSGVPADRLPLIFQPFFSTKGTKGTGLGLSIVKGGIERHGGTVRCTVSDLNGARFEIRLPQG